MKDMGDSNHGGVVYGFATTGVSWRMLSYDGASFQVSEKVEAVFETEFVSVTPFCAKTKL